MGSSDKQVENRIMPLMKGFPSKHRVKEEKEDIKNSGMYLSIKKYIQKLGHLTLFGMAPRSWVLGLLYKFAYALHSGTRHY